MIVILEANIELQQEQYVPETAGYMEMTPVTYVCTFLALRLQLSYAALPQL